MQDYIPNIGKTAEEICRIAGSCCATGAVAARFVLTDFQHLCDANGHVVKLDLPGQVCGFLRAHPGCTYAEILRTPHLADAVLIGIFNSKTAVRDIAAALSSQVFQLQHLTLPCPPMAVTDGLLERLLLEPAL
jgi:hypothetical protein